MAAVAAGGVPGLDELRLHHGTVWRWNRAVVNPGDDPHLRIEMRALPAGPSLTDMRANVAYLVGLTMALAPQMEWMCRSMPFEFARRNFTAAARDRPGPCSCGRPRRRRHPGRGRPASWSPASPRPPARASRRAA